MEGEEHNSQAITHEHANTHLGQPGLALQPQVHSLLTLDLETDSLLALNTERHAHHIFPLVNLTNQTLDIIFEV